MRHTLKTAAVLFLGFAILAIQPKTVLAAGADWFVLRTETTGDCWTAKVIQIGGDYATGSALIAGGPYATEEAAQARIAELVQKGTCRAK